MTTKPATTLVVPALRITLAPGQDPAQAAADVLAAIATLSGVAVVASDIGGALAECYVADCELHNEEKPEGWEEAKPTTDELSQWLCGFWEETAKALGERGYDDEGNRTPKGWATTD